jgi:hypothetical protein
MVFTPLVVRKNNRKYNFTIVTIGQTNICKHKHIVVEILSATNNVHVRSVKAAV